MEFKKAHYGDVRLDGIKVVAVYRGKTWIKFYVSDVVGHALARRGD